ncbi:SGNH/GDSL hydrolase family protein [Streptomyces sp. NPDC093225]|uniref:SGNH/GDSL hydrolase family protein n=1 Tax=Streptomyces sp. NPDC093225 TaxID=3366034 RepID=UPI00382937E0
MHAPTPGPPPPGRPPTGPPPPAPPVPPQAPTQAPAPAQAQPTGHPSPGHTPWGPPGTGASTGTGTRGPRRSLLAALVALAVLVTAGVCTALLAGGDDGPDGGPGGGAAAVDDGPSTPVKGSGRTAGPVDKGGRIAPHWVGTWSAAPVGPEPDTYLRGHSGRTFRNVVHTSVGGDQVRITLSNLFGVGPLRITSATVGLAAGPGTPAAEPGSLARLSFGGAPDVTIPPGDEVTSDAIGLRLPADADVLVSTYAPAAAEPGGPVTQHPGARQTSYAGEGDGTDDETGRTFTEKTGVWRHLVAVDVRTDRAVGTVVAFGDSITDGAESSTDGNRRWPDVLSDRLRRAAAQAGDGAGGAGTTGVPRLAVANTGIRGNRLLAEGTGPSGLDRFDRDVLGRAGVRVVVVELGINDVMRPSGTRSDRPEPDRILDGLRELTRRARARGLLVVGATLTPFHGHRSYSAEEDAVRRAVNAHIRAGEVFDVVVDFDRALRDPAEPSRLREAYDSGDHLHPNDAGYRAMARAVDLADLN